MLLLSEVENSFLPWRPQQFPQALAHFQLPVNLHSHLNINFKLSKDTSQHRHPLPQFVTCRGVKTGNKQINGSAAQPHFAVFLSLCLDFHLAFHLLCV